jgi:hypothetical protein
MFVEHAEPPAPGEVHDGESDTGLSIRAFLPLQSPITRTRLKEYHGPATIFDTHIVCLRPDNATTLRLRYKKGIGRSTVQDPVISGHVASSLQGRRFGTSPTARFFCEYPTPPGFAATAAKWPTSLCAKQSTVGFSVSLCYSAN